MPYPPTSVWWIVEPKNAITAPSAEHRVQHGDVEQLPGRLVRVVGDQHVALDERVGRVLVEHRRRRPGERVDVARRAGDGLGDHPAAPVEHRVGEVARLAHDRRERRPLQRLRLLVDRGDQALPQHLELDRVERVSTIDDVDLPSSLGDERAVGGDGDGPAGADHRRGLALLDDRRAGRGPGRRRGRCAGRPACRRRGRRGRSGPAGGGAARRSPAPTVGQRLDGARRRRTPTAAT